MIKIMFVCHGNICRSPMAEFVMNQLISKRGFDGLVHSRSSAVSGEELGNDVHYGTKRILEKYKVPYRQRRAVRLTKADLANYDHIVAMDESNLKYIEKIFGCKSEKVHLLLEYAGEKRDISDPWYSGNFETTYKDVLKGCEGLLDKIESEMS